MKSTLNPSQNKLGEFWNRLNQSRNSLLTASGNEWIRHEIGKIENLILVIQGQLLEMRFEKEIKLGKSLFGEVYRCSDLNRNKKKVAVKFSDRKLVSEGKTREGHKVMEYIFSEKIMLEKIRDDSKGNETIRQGYGNICALEGFFDDAKHYWTVLEYCPNGDFFAYVKSQFNGLPNLEAQRFFRQILTGVRSIHLSGIAHLDLSLENVLMMDNDTLKICDFGLARFCRSNTMYQKDKYRVGKLLYMAPEIFNRNEFQGFQCDVWSLGVMLFLMLTSIPPWDCLLTVINVMSTLRMEGSVIF